MYIYFYLLYFIFAIINFSLNNNTVKFKFIYLKGKKYF
jgi:hypothetical protein